MTILEFWPRRSPHPAVKKGNTLKQERKPVVNKHKTNKQKQDKKRKRERAKLISLKQSKAQ